MAGILITIDNPRKPNGQLKADEESFQLICEEFLSLLESLTPVDTGFCSESWSMDVSREFATFINDCDYAEYLDYGHSKQAPNGMTEPALKRLPNIARQFLR